MTAINVPNDPSVQWLRREVTDEELARGRREYEERRDQDARLQATIVTVGAVGMCLALGRIFTRRSHSAKAADRIAVDAAARGLQAKRKMESALANVGGAASASAPTRLTNDRPQ